MTLEQRPYQICVHSVMDTSDPTITFDASGASNHYLDFVNVVRPYWRTDATARAQLAQAVEAIKREGRGKDFDCLLGLSGGLDSSYLLHVVVTEFGLRPLVFHVDGGWNSELAVHNINVIVERLGLDLYTEVINWEEMREFQLAWFRAGVPHIDIPQDHAFVATLYRFADQYKIKYILNGGNISTECVRNPLRYFYWGTDMRHIRDIIKKFCRAPLPTYPFSSVFFHKFYLRYLRQVKVVKPLNFVPFVKEEASRLMQDTYGWKPYRQKHFESRFTKFFEGYWLPSRFGFDVRRVQYSSLIFTGQMTREDALKALAEPPFKSDEIARECEYVAAKLGITADELDEYHQLPRKYYDDYRNQRAVFDLGEQVLWRLAGKRRGGGY